MLAVPPIAAATFRTATASGVFWLLLLIGALTIGVLMFIPFFTFKEDVKMYKDICASMALTLLLAHGIMQAGRVVDEEFENRTALVLMAKPVRRHELLLGKYLGIAASVVLLGVLLELVFAPCSWLRLWMDDFWRRRSFYSDGRIALAADCWVQVWTTVPMMALTILQALVMTAVGTALSTRLSLGPNVVACLLIFVAGHLTPVMHSWTQFRLGEGVMRKLVEDGVPLSVMARLEPIRGRPFDGEEEFTAALRERMDADDRDKWAGAITDLSAGWAAPRHAGGRMERITSGARNLLVRGAGVALPDLERCHNLADALAYKPVVFGADKPPPNRVRWVDAWMFVLSSAVYTVIYIAAVMTGGVVLLERREVAA